MPKGTAAKVYSLKPEAVHFYNSLARILE